MLVVVVMSSWAGVSSAAAVGVGGATAGPLRSAASSFAPASPIMLRGCCGGIAAAAPSRRTLIDVWR